MPYQFPDPDELNETNRPEEAEETRSKGEPPVSTTTGGTKWTYHRPPPPDWWHRVNMQRARNDEIRATGESKIPDQGVVFDQHLPWDIWANPLRQWR